MSTHCDMFIQRYPLSSEFRLAVACSWFPENSVVESQSEQIRSLTDEVIDWESLLRLIGRHGIVGQFTLVMDRYGWHGVPEAIREQLKLIRRNQVMRSMGQTAELARLATLFRNSDIPLIPLKGVALSQQLFGNPCVRSSCDLDILVPPGKIEQAEVLLRQCGYQHYLGFESMNPRQRQHVLATLHHHEYVHESSNSHVELHWKGYQWSDEQGVELWNASRELPWLNAGMRQLAHEDEILFLLDHGARHGWACLKWLSDLAMLIHALTDDVWKSLSSRARQLDMMRMLSQTCLLLEWLYGIPMPESISAHVDRITVCTAHHAAAQLLATAEQFEQMNRRFAGLKTIIRVKMLRPDTPLSAVCRSALIAHQDFAELILPDSLFWLYIPLRPVLWFKRHYLARGQAGSAKSVGSTRLKR